MYEQCGSVSAVYDETFQHRRVEMFSGTLRRVETCLAQRHLMRTELVQYVALPVPKNLSDQLLRLAPVIRDVSTGWRQCVPKVKV